MALKLTAESFLAGVAQSGLIDGVRLDEVVRDMQRHGVDVDDSQILADELIRRNIITPWQSEKLLQGKYKGFVLGRYKLLALLGKGEMSAVYLAEHLMMRRRCAIKVLPANKVKDTSYLGRFQREAQAVAALDCPNIVRAYDVDVEVDNGIDIHYLVMEYFEGKDLEKLRAERGELDVVTATDYVRQAAEGLAHAHKAGMVHRDIKPENLLVDAHGVVKILDLGLARLDNGQNIESLTIKHNEKVLGTADYLAPEQAIDSHKVDARADIYSLGCSFYFLLTGHPPFTDGTLVQRLLAHQTRVPPAVQKERPDVPPEVVAVIEKAMAKKADERFQTARDLADALSAWLVKHAGTEWRKKHPAVVAAVLGIDALSGKSASNSSAATRAGSDILRDDPEFSPFDGAGTRTVPRDSSGRPLKKKVTRPGTARSPSAGGVAVASASRSAEHSIGPSLTPTQKITASTTPSWSGESAGAASMRNSGANMPRSRVPELREAPSTHSAPQLTQTTFARSTAALWNQKLTIVASLILTGMLLIGGIGYGLYAASDKDRPDTNPRPSFRSLENEVLQPPASLGGSTPTADNQPGQGGGN